MISVIIPTFNPAHEHLKLTLDGLKNQTSPNQLWELIIVDNNSSNAFEKTIDISWHPMARIVKEPNQGLTFARLKGFSEAKGDYIVMIDDDNIIAENYLVEAYEIFKNNPTIGCAGGISEPLFSCAPPIWLKDFYGNLALRNHGQEIFIEGWSNRYPEHAPIGAGMILRKQALSSYIKKISHSDNIIPDRKGKELSSGGDNDIVLEIIKSGWLVGYFPQLSLKHIIPLERMQADYIARLVHDSNISWVKILEQHRINPWRKINPITLLPRYLKAWIKNKAWSREKNYIKWKGDCGLFKGLSEI